MLYVFLAYSCSKRKDTYVLLSEVESLVLTNPDSALFLLKYFIPDEEDIALKAKYALLLTQAEDKNYIQHTTDSLIVIAVSYYDSIGNTEQSALAHYYLGRVYQDMQNEAAAVREYLIALPLAERNRGNKILCLLYGNLGQIYFQQDLLDNADSLFILSEGIAIQNNDSLNLAMGLVARGNICLQRKSYSDAMNFYERASVIAKNIHNTNVEQVVCNSLAALYASLNHPEKTLEYSREGLKNDMDSLSTARLYLLEGNALMQLEKYDSAKCCIRKSLCTTNLSTKATAYLLLADIEEMQGNLDEALVFQNSYIRCLDSLDMAEYRTRNEISKGDRMLHYGKYQKLLNTCQLYIVGFLLFLFILIIYAINKKHKYINKISTLTFKKNDLEQQLAILSVMQEELRKKEQELELLREFAGTVESDKARLYSLANQVNALKLQNKEFFLKLLANTKSYKNLLLLIQKRKDNSKYKEPFSEKEWDLLLKDVDYLSNGFVEKIKTRLPLLTDSDIRFCCLFKIGLSYADMALVFDRTLDAMYKKRNAILVNKLVETSNLHSFERLIESI